MQTLQGISMIHATDVSVSMHSKCALFSHLLFSSVPRLPEVKCDDPGVPANGQRVGDRFFYKDAVFYSCDLLFGLVGARLRECQANGTWTGQLPSCQRKK